MHHKPHNTALNLANALVADGKMHFSFADAHQRFGQSPAATSNMLRRMIAAGLIDRVRRGHYVVRQLGVLGTRSVSEEVALAVGAAFAGVPHRMGYRTALDEHDLIVHPARAIHVATAQSVRAKTLSGRSVHIVREPESSIRIGAIPWGLSWISDLERALLDAARRPNLIGGVAVLAEAIATAAPKVRAPELLRYAQALSWASAVRRIGSIADALDIHGLAGQLRPLKPLTGDLDLEPGDNLSHMWRDSQWRVRWPQSREELANVTKQ